MDNKAILAEMRAAYSRSGREERPPFITDEDINDWSERAGLARSEFCDRAAIQLATGFVDSDLDWEFCDAAINDMWGSLFSIEANWSQDFWEIFEAFEEGEWPRPGVDVIETVVRPRIVEIVGRRSRAETS